MFFGKPRMPRRRQTLNESGSPAWKGGLTSNPAYWRPRFALDPSPEMSSEPAGPSARIDAAATKVSKQSARVAAIRAALRRMLDDESKAEQIARAFKGL